MKKNIYSLTKDQLINWCLDNGEKKFRGKQIFEWLYQKRVSSFPEMTNLSKATRDKLTNHFTMGSLNEVTRQEASDGTVKFLFALSDKYTIETVLMNNNYGYSLCVTTQVGCRMKCAFCASGLNGLTRHLEAGEIVAQVLKVQQMLDEKNERIASIVIMGTGEPFDNFDNTMAFVNIINDDEGINIGARHITISTSGLVPEIKKFADTNSQVNFALSLHAPNDELRTELMPVNKAYPLSRVIDALRYYNEKTNRRFTIEYALFNNINDSEDCAIQLSHLLKGLKCHVNLIPANDVTETRFTKSKKHNVRKFKEILDNNHINVTIRREQGDDIDAACGQLRSKVPQI